VTERVQLLRGGQALPYVVTEEHEDGSLLLAPAPVPSAHETGPTEDARATAVAVPDGGGILEVRRLTVAYGAKMAVDASPERFWSMASIADVIPTKPGSEWGCSFRRPAFSPS